MPLRVARGLEKIAKSARKHGRQHHLPTVARRERGQRKDVLHLIAQFTKDASLVSNSAWAYSCQPLSGFRVGRDTAGGAGCRWRLFTCPMASATGRMTGAFEAVSSAG